MWWLRVHREGRRQGRGAKESQDPEITWSGCAEFQTWWAGLGHRLQGGEWEPGCLLPDVGSVTSPRHPERAGWVPMGSLGAPIRSDRPCVSKVSIVPSLGRIQLWNHHCLPSRFGQGTEPDNGRSSLTKLQAGNQTLLLLPPPRREQVSSS